MFLPRLFSVSERTALERVSVHPSCSANEKGQQADSSLAGPSIVNPDRLSYRRLSECQIERDGDYPLCLLALVLPNVRGNRQLSPFEREVN